MRLHPIATVSVLLALAACSGEDERAPASGNVFGSGATAGAGGGTSTGGTSAGGTAGDAGSSGASATGGVAGEDGGATGGTGGDPMEGGCDADAAGGKGGIDGALPGECGNGKLEPGERCDGNDFGSDTCVTLGFESGDLACVDCDIDATGCSGTETCFDAVDNDNDSEADCSDSDCADYCTNPCVGTPVLDDPGTLEGNNSGHPSSIASSCSNDGADLVFAFIPVIDGVADFTLTSTAANLTLSAQTTCGTPSSEVACNDFASGPGGTEQLTVAAQQGQAIYVVVDGADPLEVGEFELVALSRPLICGDGNRDPGEACDDGGTSPNDGCSPTCVLEPTESEPNGTPAQATAYSDGFVGSIDPMSDVDLVRVTATHPLSNIVVDTFDLGDGACTEQLMDPVVTVYGPNGTTVLAEDDDGGAGYCSHAAVGSLSPGDYFIELKRAGVGPATFPYFLSAVVDWCGNGMKTEVEQCDDGNNTPGDGCQEDCTF